MFEKCADQPNFIYLIINPGFGQALDYYPTLWKRPQVMLGLKPKTPRIFKRRHFSIGYSQRLISK